MGTNPQSWGDQTKLMLAARYAAESRPRWPKPVTDLRVEEIMETKRLFRPRYHQRGFGWITGVCAIGVVMFACLFFTLLWWVASHASSGSPCGCLNGTGDRATRSQDDS